MILRQMESAERSVSLTRERPWMVKKFISEWKLFPAKIKNQFDKPLQCRYLCSGSLVAYPAKILFQNRFQRSRLSKQIRLHDTQEG